MLYGWDNPSHVQNRDIFSNYSPTLKILDQQVKHYNLFDLKLFWGAKEYGSVRNRDQ
jgi:hypothetical protein